MTITSALESVASDTWGRLRDSRSLQVRFGEETITDLVLLELKRRGEPGLHIVQTDKHKEKISGTDWEWWIGSPRIGWLRFAIQAKKLTLSSSRYDQLNHKVGSIRQVDLLEKYALRHKAVPLYCLFNFAGPTQAKNAWRCCQDYEESQLACTVVPSSVVRHALANKGSRTFQKMHQSPRCLPWRCLAKCPRVLKLHSRQISASAQLEGAKALFGTAAVLHKELPVPLREATTSGFIALDDTGQSVEARRMQPRQIAIMEFTEEEENSP